MDESPHIRQRVLAVKLEFDWKREADRALYQRLRDLGWQAARYRNEFVRAIWAQSKGFRAPESDDKNGTSKSVRQTDKGQLSGASYSAAEREAVGSWQRDARKILAGQPLPEWKPSAALSVRGHKSKSESGIRLEIENDQYVAYLAAQSKDSPGGCWLRLPIAKHTRRDEYQGEVLNKMVSWEIPIAKASIQIKERKRRVILRLTYAVTVPLPKMGDRVATLGPIEWNHRKQTETLHLRTETQTKDYTSTYLEILDKKDSWDLIRRRLLRQIGWKKGQARAKREALAQRYTSFEEWSHDRLHRWTCEIADWCASQGVGTIRYQSIDTGDWPAYKFVQLLTYKAEDRGMQVVEGADVSAESSDRSLTAAIKKQQKKATRTRAAVRELEHQIGAD